MSDTRPHFLIVTVGTTPALLEYTINEHQPDGVVFLASKETLGTTEQITPFLTGRRTFTVVLENAEDWLEAYNGALACVTKALDWAPYQAPRLTADFTGGTKIMSAGLALALSYSGRQVGWSYVGASRSNRDPVSGRVMSGFEYLVMQEDPVESLFLREKASLQRAWNAWSYGECEQILETMLTRHLTHFEAQLYRAYLVVVQSVGLWDRFQYRAASARFSEAVSEALVAARGLGERDFVTFLERIAQTMLPQLYTLEQKPGPSLAVVQDLLANAQRRAAAGRFDDALFRYRRAAEVAVELGRSRSGRTRGSGTSNREGASELAEQLERDIKQGDLKSYFERLENSILLGGYNALTAEDYEQTERYFLNTYETYGFHPARGWPRWV